MLLNWLRLHAISLAAPCNPQGQGSVYWEEDRHQQVVDQVQHTRSKNVGQEEFGSQWRRGMDDVVEIRAIQLGKKINKRKEPRTK